MDLLDTQIHSRIGTDGLTRLVAAFYRQVPGDDILGPMYQKRDLAAAEQRMREFLIQRFGGPDWYSQKRGHPRLRMRHSPFHINQAARDRWMTLMETAMAEVSLPIDVLQMMRKFFHDAATFMINQPE
ncbi:MAG TPA: globin [Tepidisphaeraceae bacterium]|nr:globin [Tepidisphaeraceae bacterium]